MTCTNINEQKSNYTMDLGISHVVHYRYWAATNISKANKGGVLGVSRYS